MFSKKKSLAKIAQVRSKKEASPAPTAASATGPTAAEALPSSPPPPPSGAAPAAAAADLRSPVVVVQQAAADSRTVESNVRVEDVEDSDLQPRILTAVLPPSPSCKRLSLDSCGSGNDDDEDSEASSNLDVPTLTRQTSVSTPNLVPQQYPPKRNAVISPMAAGSLHESHQPISFDHDYEPHHQTQQQTMAKSLLTKRAKDYLTLGSSDESLSPANRNKSFSSSSNSPRRTQSVRVGTPILKLQDEDGNERSPMQSNNIGGGGGPTRGPVRSRSARYIRRRPNPSKDSPPPRMTNQVPNPNHVSPTPSPAQSPYASDDDDDEGDYDDDGEYGYNDDEEDTKTPSGADPHLSPFRDRKDSSVTKSRSMNSLDPLALSLATVGACSASQARTRSYLMGSIGATSLLGPQELEKCFPDRRLLRLFVGTWNMNGKAPPRHLADFLLPQSIEFVPDILVVATQESFPERGEWEIRLQDTLGPSHVLFHSAGMGTLHLVVFLRRDLIWYCSLPETDSFNAHPGNQFRTKGAVAVAFLLFGTSFLFINSHLTAHEENAKDRIRDYRKITAMLNLPRDLPTRSARHREISDKFDCVFWCGDLNFRVAQAREVVLQEVDWSSSQEGTGTTGGNSRFGSILEFDQLNFLRREGFIFKGYNESEIHFPPTYKYDVGTNQFDSSSKQRTPSYTDRILYKSLRSTSVSPVNYDSVQGVLTSDHRPVWGMWEVRLRPGRDTVPLAGGMFNREVYLAGLKRRVEALQPVKNGHSNHMCSLQ